MDAQELNFRLFEKNTKYMFDVLEYEDTNLNQFTRFLDKGFNIRLRFKRNWNDTFLRWIDNYKLAELLFNRGLITNDEFQNIINSEIVNSLIGKKYYHNHEQQYTSFNFEKYDYLRTRYGPIILSEELEQKLIKHLYLDRNLDILKHVRFNANNNEIRILLTYQPNPFTSEYELNTFAPEILAYLIETGQLNPYFEENYAYHHANLVEVFIMNFRIDRVIKLESMDKIIKRNMETILSFFEIFSMYNLEIRNKEWLIENAHVYFKIIDLYDNFLANRKLEKKEIKRIAHEVIPPELVDIIGRNVMVDNVQAEYIPPERIEFSFEG